MQNRSENQVCRDWVLLRSKISSDPSPLCVVLDHDAASHRAMLDDMALAASNMYQYIVSSFYF